MQLQQTVEQVVAEISKIIIGKPEQIRMVLAAIFCGGHVLLDDLPGTGKTTLVKTTSRVMGCGFSRVQFTPDLLPSDIVGMRIFNQKTGDFAVAHGPVRTNFFLADEINRAIPRTQAALLEVMEECQVTIDGETYQLPQPFIVLATQNPVEMESTFHLPVAQMDRFLIRLSLGYPAQEEEVVMLKTVGDEIPFASLKALLDADSIMAFQKEIRSVYVSDAVLSYIVALTGATRGNDALRLPVGPRGSRALYRAGKAWAAMSGRDYVTPDDIQTLALPVLCHRVTLSNEARLAGQTARDVILRLMEAIPVPPGKEEMLRAKG